MLLSDEDIHSLNRIQEELLTRYTEEIPLCLYHYTTADGLMSILSQNLLRASNAYFLNDSSEVHHALEVISKALAGMNGIADLGDPVKFVSKLQESVDLYITCFCEKGNLLSQWRGYGDQGGGFSIGFDLRSVPNTSLLLRKVVYSNTEKQQRIEAIIGRYQEWMKQYSSHYHSNEHLRAKFKSYLGLNLFECALSFKDDSFSEEQEWRLIKIVKLDQRSDLDAIQFRTNKNRMIPYINLTLGDHPSRLPVKQVYLGPNGDSNLAKKSLELFKLKNDLGYLEILPSCIPFRG